MAGISLILQNSPNITEINCGTSSPRLSGTVDISSFTNLTGFSCTNNDITALSGYNNNSNIVFIDFSDNKLTGPLPAIRGMTSLQVFECFRNQFSGPLPSFTGLASLTNFICRNNNFSGPLPSLNTNTNMRTFQCSLNDFTGAIPSFSNLPNLQNYDCNGCRLSGPIPNLSALTNLRTFYCFGQLGATKMTSFAGGSVSNFLGNFQAQNNNLPSTAVNGILASFVAAGRTTVTPQVNGTCILNVGGAGNFRPTGQGVTDVITLRSRGWTITTGTL